LRIEHAPRIGNKAFVERKLNEHELDHQMPSAR